MTWLGDIQVAEQTGQSLWSFDSQKRGLIDNSTEVSIGFGFPATTLGVLTLGFRLNHDPTSLSKTFKLSFIFDISIELRFSVFRDL